MHPQTHIPTQAHKHTHLVAVGEEVPEAQAVTHTETPVQHWDLSCKIFASVVIAQPLIPDQNWGPEQGGAQVQVFALTDHGPTIPKPVFVNVRWMQACERRGTDGCAR
jgi:hypothetical protein